MVINDGYKAENCSLTLEIGKHHTLNMTLQKAAPDKFDLVVGVVHNDVCKCHHSYRKYRYIHRFILHHIRQAAGEYGFTVTAEGYKTVTGTVAITADVAESEITEHIVRLVVCMVKDDEGGIETVTDDAAATGITVYPTLVEDEVYIVPAFGVEGRWTVRIVSVSGLNVYTATHRLGAETAIAMGYLPKGLYLMILDNGTERHYVKLIKK